MPSRGGRRGADAAGYHRGHRLRHPARRFLVALPAALRQGLINGSFGGGFDQLPGIAYLYAGGDSDAPETVVRAILDEAQRLAREGVDEAFYQQLRRASFGSTLRALNSFENIAVSVADGAFRGFDPFRFPEVYDSVTRADVEAFLRESIVEERSALSILIPKKEGASQ